ncbi:unnamed protein product [Lupinus luteus]|uniref:Uncharacterized protein n=1 Tax=Lupinus luteus TaxID=3873 RepID=A0AAV1VU29_LUPLU
MHVSSSYHPIASFRFSQTSVRLILALLRQVLHLSVLISPLHSAVAYTLSVFSPYERL